MEVHLINGKWVSIEKGKIETFNELSPIRKKLFMILLNCELILKKHGLTNNNKNEKNSITSVIAFKLQRFEKLFNRFPR